MNMITPFHNYDSGYICLVDIPLHGMPEEVKVHGHVLHRKTEFHISLICVKKITPLIDNARNDQLAAEIVDAFIAYVKDRPLAEFRLSKNFRFVQRGERKTVVVMVDMPGLSEFFELLSNRYGVKLPVQPAHITLYTLQPDAGIGILSGEQLNQDSEACNIPELSQMHVRPECSM